MRLLKTCCANNSEQLSIPLNKLPSSDSSPVQLQKSPPKHGSSPPPTPSSSFHAPLCPPPPSLPPTSASQFVASKIQVVGKVILFFVFMIMILLSFYFLFLTFFNFIFGKVECQNDHCNTPGFTYDSYNGGFNWTIHILPATRSFKVRFPKF